MTRFKLRYGQQVILLPIGEFKIGRSEGNDLSLDDHMVSRRHLTLHVTTEGVEAEDANSRNGVLVNGLALVGRTRLEAGDVVAVGDQELELLETGRTHPRRKGAITRRERVSLIRGVHELAARGGQTGTIRPDELLISDAERSIASGDHSTALGAFELLDRRINESLALREPPDRGLVDRYLRALLATAAALDAPDLVVKAFFVAERTKTPPNAEAVHSLRSLVRSPGVDRRAFNRCIEVLREAAPSFDFEDRTRLQRLEDLHKDLVR